MPRVRQSPRVVQSRSLLDLQGRDKRHYGPLRNSLRTGLMHVVMMSRFRDSLVDDPCIPGRDGLTGLMTAG